MNHNQQKENAIKNGYTFGIYALLIVGMIILACLENESNDKSFWLRCGTIGFFAIVMICSLCHHNRKQKTIDNKEKQQEPDDLKAEKNKNERLREQIKSLTNQIEDNQRIQDVKDKCSTIEDNSKLAVFYAMLLNQWQKMQNEQKKSSDSKDNIYAIMPSFDDVKKQFDEFKKNL